MNSNTADSIRGQTTQIIQKIKQQIPIYTGMGIESRCFVTGRITVLRRSLTDIFEHAVEDETICEWLKSFRIETLKKMKYRGWAPNRPYPENHPKYNLNDPFKSKHNNDSFNFFYYTIKIGKYDYWVNVKNHKHFGEVIYTIEKEKPCDLIKGHKKVTLKTSIPPHTGGANHINITMQR